MNEKDLERKMDEKITNIVIDLLKTGQLDEKIAELLEVTSGKKSGTKIEKVSRSKKRRIGKMIERISDDENVANMIGFTCFKDGSGLVFGNTDDNVVDVVDILMFMIVEVYGQVCDDETDNAKFEDFLHNLMNNTRGLWILKKGLLER